MSLERTREALDALLGYAEPDMYENAAAEVARVEAVIQAARNCVRGVDEQLRMSMGNSPYVSLYDLRAALRALDGEDA